MSKISRMLSTIIDQNKAIIEQNKRILSGSTDQVRSTPPPNSLPDFVEDVEEWLHPQRIIDENSEDE